MKKFFSRRKSSQPVSNPPNTTVPAQAPLPSTRPVSLRPKFIVPPVPHPCPYSAINIVVTPEGLVLRPDLQESVKATHHVRIAWGKDIAVEEIEGDAPSGKAAASVHGIVGFLKLFHASYLLVITAKTEVGNLFDEPRIIYRLDGVSAIPLEENRATAAINMLYTLTNAREHPPIPEEVPDGAGTSESQRTNEDTKSEENKGNEDDGTSGLRVTFVPAEKEPTSSTLTAEDVDLLQASSAESSGRSTPTTTFSTAPMAKALAAQLSFWNRLSKRSPDHVIVPPELRSPSTETVDSFDGKMASGEGSAEVLKSIIAKSTPPPKTTEEQHSELDEKIVRETIKEFVKGGMFFSYIFDITTSLQRKQQRLAKLKRTSTLLQDLEALDEQPQVSLASDEADPFEEPNLTLPLWRRVDKKFWWNEALSQPLIDAGLHSYVLPVMQGYYQVASFHIPATSVTTFQPSESTTNEEVEIESTLNNHYIVDYAVVSRRSRERAGLRYQRRGIDDNANVANFVETETIMRITREGQSNIFSYVQVRGSIPLFWSQPGYGLKPPPQLSKDRTPEQNKDAMKRHMARVAHLYGPLVAVNLAEQTGKEGAITAAYRETMQELNSPDAKYHEYDFHAETKGMRYENISRLIQQLERTFESQGFFWVSGGTVLSQQKGVFRVNCIDCLDRTNVVQSAFARFILQTQLEAVAVHGAYETGDRSEADIVFNDVWANNGDAISRIYAGTSALKGDFTRTGKRDISGLLNDGLNSLSRVYTSTFSDWFCQAVIDYMLGNRGLSVFSEFLSKLSSTDPGELMRVSKIRAVAIETCWQRVLSEEETQIAGWTLLSPTDLNTKMSEKFEEKVLLLTSKALYIVSYDYNLEKVKLFTRVPLGDITGISKGIYILSPLEEASRRATDNYGFLISYLPSGLTTRVNSYSIRNTIAEPASPTAASAPPPKPPPPLQRMLTNSKASLSKVLNNVVVANGIGETGKTVIAAFKALPVERGKDRGNKDGDNRPGEDALADCKNCQDAVDVMVEMIRKACEDAGSAGEEGFVKEEDIVSLAEAHRMTTVFAKMEYNFKRLLWLGS